MVGEFGQPVAQQAFPDTTGAQGFDLVVGNGHFMLQGFQVLLQLGGLPTAVFGNFQSAQDLPPPGYALLQAVGRPRVRTSVYLKQYKKPRLALSFELQVLPGVTLPLICKREAFK